MFYYYKKTIIIVDNLKDTANSSDIHYLAKISLNTIEIMVIFQKV